jgi:hypothetical protein
MLIIIVIVVVGFLHVACNVTLLLYFYAFSYSNPSKCPVCLKNPSHCSAVNVWMASST